MDATPQLLRPQGSARTRLLVDDRVVVVDAHGGTEPVARATPAFGEGSANLAPRRATPLSIPFTPVTLVGRDTELAEIADALEAGETVVLSAGPGFGKTALLHHLGSTSGADYPDGALLLSARGRTIDDLQFEVFRSCFEVPGRRPGARDLRRHLADVKALLLIDDVVDPAPLARALAAAAPYSRVVLATEAEPIARDLLGELAAVEVLEDEVVEDEADADVELAAAEGDLTTEELADDAEPVDDLEDEVEQVAEVETTADELEDGAESTDEPELADDEPEALAETGEEATEDREPSSETADTEFADDSAESTADEPELAADTDDEPVAEAVAADTDDEPVAEAVAADADDELVAEAAADIDAEIEPAADIDEETADDREPSSEPVADIADETTDADPVAEPTADEAPAETPTEPQPPPTPEAAPPPARKSKKNRKRKPAEGSGDHD